MRQFRAFFRISSRCSSPAPPRKATRRSCGTKIDDALAARMSWREAAEQVAALAAVPLQADRHQGRGDLVMLVSENRPEFCIADLAIMAAGCVTVPTYTTNTERDHQHILDDSGARAVIVSTQKLAKPLMPAALSGPRIIASHVDLRPSLLPSPEPRPATSSTFYSWSDLCRRRAKLPSVAGHARPAPISGRDDLACLDLRHTVGHRRRAARGDAAPWRDPAQLRGLHGTDRRGFRLGRRGFPVVSAAQPRL